MREYETLKLCNGKFSVLVDGVKVAEINKSFSPMRVAETWSMLKDGIYVSHGRTGAMCLENAVCAGVI